MSVLGDAIQAARDVLRLSDQVKAVAGQLKELGMELRDQDRRITRLEAKWEAAIELAALRSAPRLVGDPGRQD